MSRHHSHTGHGAAWTWVKRLWREALYSVFSDLLYNCSGETGGQGRAIKRAKVRFQQLKAYEVYGEFIIARRQGSGSVGGAGHCRSSQGLRDLPEAVWSVLGINWGKGRRSEAVGSFA